MSCLHNSLQSLVASAVLAPSSDNTQPWRFILDPQESTVAVHLDPARDSSPMNAGQRMSRIACGAALENLVRAARRRGWQAIQEAPADGALARIRVRPETDGNRDACRDSALELRCTNRRPYDGRPVPERVMASLREACPAVEGVRTYFLTEAQGRQRCGEADARATALMYLQPSMRRAILRQIRFDATAHETPADGLSLASLELSAIERHALPLAFKSPNWLLQCAGLLRRFAGYTRKLHRSASGLCLLTAPDDKEATDLLVGRAMQRAWLALAGQGLAAQPMMSVMELDNVRKLGPAGLVDAIGRERIVALVNQLLAGFGIHDSVRPAFLLRFGYAPPPTGRSGRRPVFEVLETPPARQRRLFQNTET